MKQLVVDALLACCVRRSAVLVTLLLCAVGRCAVLDRPAEGKGDVYDIGVGRHDITGRTVGVGMMGYSRPEQVSTGLHTRLYARAFLIGDGENRIVFVNCDMSTPSQVIKMKVVERLSYTFGDTYTTSNIILSVTHTHSGPGGYGQYVTYQVSTHGFIEEEFEAIVDGIVKSIHKAHNSLTRGRLYFASGELLDASINRSPSAYLNNPGVERSKYSHDTDKTMTMLKLVSEDGAVVGMINWFAVHATSMNYTNKLVSGDNKGFAEELFEKAMDPGSLTGQSSFVAAFAQANCGDVSPNTDGPKCQDTGEPCDLLTSTCNGRVALCYAAGPGRDMVESTKIIGTRQFEKAMELFNDTNATPVRGPVRAISQQVDMENYTVELPNGTLVETCPAALGYSTIAGTTDGPGVLDFKQGMTESTRFWDFISKLLILSPSPEQVACHHPKPILINSADARFPYDWSPRIIETQLVSVGQFVIAALPGEFTTMAGRRLREKITSVFRAKGQGDTTVVLAGLCNEYTQYITTHEEYSVQRYEGASTLYGPHTLDAYIQQFTKLASAMLKGEKLPPGPKPPNFLPSQVRLSPREFFDAAPFGSSFGEVLVQPQPVAYPGDTVTAVFASGCPANMVQGGESFATVERLSPNGGWRAVATDADWDTRFVWERTDRILRSSKSTVTWTVPEKAAPGTYRLTHSGRARALFGDPEPYKGITNTFTVPELRNNLVENDASDSLISRNVDKEL